MIRLVICLITGQIYEPADRFTEYAWDAVIDFSFCFIAVFLAVNL